MRPNKLIDALEKHPCTAKEFPYRFCAYMELSSQKRSHKRILKKIHEKVLGSLSTKQYNN